MLVRLSSFSGEIPRTAPDKLPAANAVRAMNCRLTSGDLEPWRAPVVQKKIYGVYQGPQTIYYYIPNSMFLTFDIDTDIVPSPIAQDQYGRIYLSDATNGIGMAKSTDITQDGLGRVTVARRPLGIPAPAGTATITGTGGASSTLVVRALVYTYVSDMGEEGPPSPPSLSVQMKQDDTLNVSNMSGDPGLPNHISKIRLYVTSVGTAGAVFQFLAEETVGTTSKSYTINSMTLGETLPSTYWVAPPAMLRGLVPISGNFIAGFLGNAVYFSEPNFPHAWPVSYMLTFNFNVVGLAVDGNTLVVLTNSAVYLVTVPSPDTATVTTFPDIIPCVSKRSISQTPSGSIFAGQDGLYLANSGGVSLLTQQFFTKPQWLALVPSTMHAGYQNGVYTFFYGGSAGYAFIPSESEAALTEIGFYASAAAGVKPQDELALAYYSTDHVEIAFWDSDLSLVMSYFWKSRLVVTPDLVNFSCIRVTRDTTPTVSKSSLLPPTNLGGALGMSMVAQYSLGGDWTTSSITSQSDTLQAHVFAGGIEVFSSEIQDDTILMLPSGFMDRKWQIALEGNVRVQNAIMGTGVTELMAGPLLPGASV